MASSTNCVVAKFFSKYPSLNCLGVDLFCQTLDYSEFYFVFPPISLGVNVLKFLAYQQARGIFIIPIWSKSVWFNFIFQTADIVHIGFLKCTFFHPSSKPMLILQHAFSTLCLIKWQLSNLILKNTV